MNDHRRLTYNILFFVGVGISLVIGVCCLKIPQRTAVFFLKLLINFGISGVSSVVLYVGLGLVGISKIGQSWRINNLFTIKRFGQVMSVLVIILLAVMSLALSEWLNHGGLSEGIITKGMLFETVGTFQYVGWSFVGIAIALFGGCIYYNKEQITDWIKS